MVTEQQLIDLILIAQSYNLELGEKMIDEQKKGCDDCADKLANQILQLIMLVEQLYYKIEINDYGEETESLYTCLLGAVAAYSGASLSLDPNAVNPNITIDVTIIGNNQPNELTFYWSEFIDNGEEGRIRYENAELAGWTPIFVIGNIDKHLLKYVDFNPLSTGGFELLPSGNIPAIYEGQVGWIVGYEPYVASSYPPAGTYRLVNNSTINTSYFITSSIPLVAGQTVNSAFTSGDSLLGQIAIGQKLNFTRYLSDGTVDLTLELTNPPSTQLSTSIMDLTKSYEFVYINTELPLQNASDQTINYQINGGSVLSISSLDSIVLKTGDILNMWLVAPSTFSYIFANQNGDIENTDGGIHLEVTPHEWTIPLDSTELILYTFG